MNKQKTPINIHDYYHAHVYFEQETLEFARKLCNKGREIVLCESWYGTSKPNRTSHKVELPNNLFIKAF